jgi:fumarylacetoacetase
MVAHDIRKVPSYLVDKGDVTYDISVNMEVIQGGSATVQSEMRVARSSLRNSYWTFRQMVRPLPSFPLVWDVVLSRRESLQLAFHTLSGCRMRTGDLIATGTLSGEV